MLVEGDLVKIIDKSFRGDVVYSTTYPNRLIGGLTLSRETIPLDYSPPYHAELEYAILEIVVEAPHNNVDWRVKANGISITKEFKPLASAKINDRLYAKVVYDITSILKTPESRRRRRINVTFKREGGDFIVIHQLSVLGLYRADDAESHITYLTGVVGLDPGENKTINIDYSRNNPLLRTSLYVPSRSANILVNIDDKYGFNINNVQGMSEIVKEIAGANGLKYIEYRHLESGERYFPKKTIISNLLIYNVDYHKPDLYIDVSDIPSIIKKGDRVKIRIFNKGVSKPDKVLLVIMSLGNIILSRPVEPVEPGQEVSLEPKIDLPSGSYELVFRIVWRKLSQTLFRDVRKNIEIVV